MRKDVCFMKFWVSTLNYISKCFDNKRIISTIITKIVFATINVQLINIFTGTKKLLHNCRRTSFVFFRKHNDSVIVFVVVDDNLNDLQHNTIQYLTCTKSYSLLTYYIFICIYIVSVTWSNFWTEIFVFDAIKVTTIQNRKCIIY